MCEQFTNEFMTKLEGLIPNEYLNIIRDELFVFSNNYSIEKQCTDVAVYSGYVPECYKVYMVTMRIEGMSDESLKSYHLVLSDFFKSMNKDISLITTNDIRVYLYNVQKTRNICNRTLDNRRSIIHAFLEWSCNEGYISSNPCRNISPIKYEIRERESLTPMELEQVRDACTTLREKAMVELLYSTGCRVTELERLNKSDVDFSSGEIILFGKGNKHRISYVGARAELALQNYLDSRDDDNEALFVSSRKPHDRLKKSAIEKIIRTIGEHSEINRRLFPHLIRHTTATDCLDRGMNITQIQKMLGHANINTTMIYAKASQQSIKQQHSRCIV